eukprot:gene11465-13363_t
MSVQSSTANRVPIGQIYKSQSTYFPPKLRAMADLKFNISSPRIQVDGEERKAEELQKLLLETIPVVIKGIELLGQDMEAICSADALVEKRSSFLNGKPKLISLRNNMDQMVWENISKMTILREFIELTLDIQKLYVVALSIRDSKHAFNNNKCEHFIKHGAGEQADGSGLISPKKASRPIPTVLSRAPRQVLDSTRELVDNAITRKCMSREEKANVFREMMSDRAFQMKEDPKAFGKNLLIQRRSKLLNSATAEEDGAEERRARGSHGSGSTDAPVSPMSSPPTSPEFAKTLGIKKLFLPSSLSPGHGLSPHGPSSPRASDKHYKMLSMSPASSVLGSGPSFQQLQVSAQTLAPLSSGYELEWEKYDIEAATGASTYLTSAANGFKIDVGHTTIKSVPVPDDCPVLHDEDDHYLYRDDFYDREHYNFLGHSKGSERNPVAISVCSNTFGSEVELLYIIRTPERDERVKIVCKKECASKDMIKIIKKARVQLANYKFKEVKEEKFPTALLDFEKKNTVHKNFKFGVLYAREGQTEENQIYGNHEPLSANYQAFVDLLGERVELKDWKEYRGGLDIRDNMTGTHAIYRVWRNYEIMFHVATMIPYKSDDEQQIDRKRHLGNDIVMIVFKEGSEPFDPSICKSNFNHVFAVVQVDEETSTADTTNYKLSISCRDEVNSFGPAFPKYHRFSGKDLKEFLISK